MDQKIREGFDWQISACRMLGSPLTADVLSGVVGAVDRTTRTGERILNWPGDPKADAMMLRIAGGLHALARSKLDVSLTTRYAEQSCDWEAEIKRVLTQWDDWLFPWLDNAPQTNEVARSGVLFPGVMEVSRRFGPKFEFLELGASAGLNLNMERFSYNLGGSLAGDQASQVKIKPEWRGDPVNKGPVEVLAKYGVDLNPLDVTDEATADRMLAYIWPDQSERVVRAAAAINLMKENPGTVDKADGALWLAQKLAEPQLPGTTRLVYHSIALQYFTAEGQHHVHTAIEAAGSIATDKHRLAWLSMEFPNMQQNVELSLRCWPGSGEREVLATCHPHGAWVNWKKR